MTVRATTLSDAGCQLPQACDVIVLGAGVIGVTTAYALARRGFSVTLVDRENAPAMGASFANGAQLSYAYSDALGSPALLKKLPGLALGADPLFRIRPSLDPDFLRWGISFLRACNRQAQFSATLAILALALESRLALHALLERHPLSFWHTVPGKMHMYFDREALKSATEMVAAKQAHGAVQSILSATEARTLEPALEGARGLEGVVYSPQDEVGDPYSFCRALVRVLTEQYGVRTMFGMAVRDVTLGNSAVTVTGEQGEHLEGRTLVVALGISSSALLAKLGIHPPLQPLKGYSFTAPAGIDAPRISLTDAQRKIVFCNLDGRIRVAGGAELGEWSTNAVPAMLARLTQSARESLPLAADYDHLDSSWAGLRPMTPTSVPIISRPHPRLVMNVGHGMLGWTLAMGSAERAASLILKNQENATLERTIDDAA